MNTALWFALACSLLAIGYGVVSVKWILSQPDGNDRMREIALAIQEGAKAYLNRQYTTIGVVGIVLTAVLFYFLGWATAVRSRSVAGPSPACWWWASACSGLPVTTRSWSGWVLKTRCTRWSAWPSAAR